MDSCIKISVCIPFYRRPDLVMETLAPLITDDRIDEIILCDDCSPMDEFHKLIKNTEGLPKIRIVKNVINHHVQHSKRNAISFAKNEWCLILDNDNVYGTDAIDKFFQQGQWNPSYIYHPCKAGIFDYSHWNGALIKAGQVYEFCKINIFMTLLNTNNFFVNRDEFLKVYEYNEQCRGSDGIFNNYNWLKSGRSIYIVPDMIYNHRISHDSAFLAEADANMKKAYYWFDKVKQL
jgi:hypothetical protein